MLTAPIAIALLGMVTAIAIAIAALTLRRVRIARAALQVSEAKEIARVAIDQKMDADRRLAGDIAHDLNDLLTAITGHTELLIASLDPSGTMILDAYEIRRAALSAAQLTKPLRALGGAAAIGTTYTVNLPPAPPPEPVPEPAVVRSAATVMVVDDEPGVRELIRVILLRAGHNVIAVAGPHAAIAALSRQPAIDIMLVDVVMPEMDGYDLVAEVRTMAAGVHVVLMSAFAPDAMRLSAGDGFLAKPFTAESLTAIVDEALGRAAPGPGRNA
jgi:CheY-like chemotaxis protein